VRRLPADAAAGCLFVRNLNDSGPGSFRETVAARGPRINVFQVGAMLTLQSPIRITEPFVTIADQTAPGTGICFHGSEVSADNLLLFSRNEVDGRKLWTAVARPFEAPAVRTTTAEDALRDVLAGAGCAVPRRDAVDERLTREVRERGGRIIDSQRDVGGWPEYPGAHAPADSDVDGIPDAWEVANGLKPHDSKDAAAMGKDGYSQIEVYINSRARP
jgi:hypothetical protein